LLRELCGLRDHRDEPSAVFVKELESAAQASGSRDFVMTMKWQGSFACS
jgi:hypothetical protein